MLMMMNKQLPDYFFSEFPILPSDAFPDGETPAVAFPHFLHHRHTNDPSSFANHPSTTLLFSTNDHQAISWRDLMTMEVIGAAAGNNNWMSVAQKKASMANTEIRF
ncbi:unnamed protein product [Linum trigynum]|uniref:Uncharacterized protein n=1 Tax=Linum trigynum TaxID=586398 RepID=A0AAV2EBC0_9ROSI